MDPDIRQRDKNKTMQSAGDEHPGRAPERGPPRADPDFGGRKRNRPALSRRPKFQQSFSPTTRHHPSELLRIASLRRARESDPHRTVNRRDCAEPGTRGRLFAWWCACTGFSHVEVKQNFPCRVWGFLQGASVVRLTWPPPDLNHPRCQGETGSNPSVLIDARLFSVNGSDESLGPPCSSTHAHRSCISSTNTEGLVPTMRASRIYRVIIPA